MVFFLFVGSKFETGLNLDICTLRHLNDLMKWYEPNEVMTRAVNSMC